MHIFAPATPPMPRCDVNSDNVIDVAYIATAISVMCAQERLQMEVGE